MRKEKFIYQYGIIILLTLCITVCACVVYASEYRKSWQQFIKTPSEIEALLQELQESPLIEEERITLCFQGQGIPYIQSEKTFLISQPLSTSEIIDVKQKFEGVLSAYGTDAHLVIERDEYTDDLSKAITDGHTFRAYVITKNLYEQINILLTGMPVVSLSTEYSETPQYTIEQIDDYVYNSETRYYGKMDVFENVSVASYDVCFHEKGQTSGLFDKNNYSIKLLDSQGKGLEASMFDMPYSEKWKLQALYADVTKIREKVSLDLWEEMANAQRMTTDEFRENGAQMEYCEVILDGEYQGLYGMMYPINDDTLQMKKDDVLYKIMDWNMPYAEDIQMSIEQNYEVCYPIRIRYPEKFSSIEKYWEPMQYYLACKYWGMNLELYADMTYAENLADYYIYIQAVSGFDNYLKNTFVWATKADNVNGYKMTTLPWDMNYTFGDCYVYDGDNNYTKYNPDTTIDYVEPVLEQLFRSNINGCSRLLYDKWNYYRQEILSTEHIQSIMQENMEYLVQTGAMQRECDTWLEVQNSSDISEMLRYVEERMKYLDEYFASFKIE